MRNFIKKSDGGITEIQENEISLARLDQQMREMEAVQEEEKKKGGKLTREEKKETKEVAREKVGNIFNEKNLPLKDRIDLELLNTEEIAFVDSLSPEQRIEFGLDAKKVKK